MYILKILVRGQKNVSLYAWFKKNVRGLILQVVLVLGENRLNFHDWITQPRMEQPIYRT